MRVDALPFCVIWRWDGVAPLQKSEQRINWRACSYESKKKPLNGNGSAPGYRRSSALNRLAIDV